jgi:hypothetical protein
MRTLLVGNDWAWAASPQHKAVSSADQWLRQKDAIRKQSFTLTNFNRPEYVMDLATVTEADWVARSMAQAIGVPVVETDPLQGLAVAVRSLQLLIVLDNAEHLVAEVAQVVQTLLLAAPGLRVARC